MPYSIRKDGKRYAVVNRETGKVYGHTTSRAMAARMIRAIEASKHGKKRR